MRRLDQYWYSRNLLAWLLLPLSWLFCLVAVLRRFSYTKQWLPSYTVPVPVIIVGNISVGGTGKTPLLIALCEHLVKHGYRPGVVSRGYGADIHGEHVLTANDDARHCGDEPVLIFQRSACPVAVGRDRVAAANSLLAAHDCDVVLSDDGMQHYRLKRDIEIAVVDQQRQFGNGFCLPAGPLREPLSRLNSVDMVVYHGHADTPYHFRLETRGAVNLDTAEHRELASFAGAAVHAVAGIGYPGRFFAQLRSVGLSVIEHPFPDHHEYLPADIEFGDAAPVLMTEKDAVKCRALRSDGSTVGKDRDIWVVPVSVIMSDRLGIDLIAQIRQGG